jgi:hypothetical protein
MDTDKIASGIGELIKNPLLLLTIIGLGLCLVAGLGSWPGSQSAPIELPWRVGLGIIGLAVAGLGLVLVVPQAIKTGSVTKRGFEGKYYAKGNPKYVNEINRISDNIYRISSKYWEGVGFVDGNFYYGIYKYTDHPDTAVPGNRGAHRAEIRYINELPVFVIELSDKFENIGKQSIWEKAEKADVR